LSDSASRLTLVLSRSDRSFAEELPELLRQRGWSLRKLAKTAGVSPSHLSRVLRRADYKTAGGELAGRVAVALGLPQDYFPEFREAAVIARVRADSAWRDDLYDQAFSARGR
jgi:transcriptional regulator with XRE-family HTH domain